MAKIARRAFLIGAAAMAGGLAVGYYQLRKPYPNPLERELAEGEVAFNPYVKIGADNTITIAVARAEMGQGVYTTLAALAAEELDVPLDKVVVEHGPAGWAYYNAASLSALVPFAPTNEGFLAESMRASIEPTAKLFGIQATGGSSSVRDGYVKMREAGCAARLMLVAAAAARWGVRPETLATRDGSVSDPASGRTATYGELAAEAAAMEPPDEVTLKPRSQWKLLGKPQKRVDIAAKVTGTATFGIDVQLPGMLHATVRMSPRLGAPALANSDAAARAVPGVLKVVPLATRFGNGFGIVATNTWAAFRGAEAIEVEWGEAPYPGDSAAQFAELAAAVDRAGGWTLRNDGDVDAAMADGAPEELIEVEYRAPFLAHACLEPMNATARWKDGVLEVWAPNQVASVIQMCCAPLVGVEAEDVVVHTTYMGGGFGRRLEVDYAAYAVLLARETEGRPVKVTWTREEDTRHDYYRPAAVCRARARIAAGEGPVAVDMRSATASVMINYMGRIMPWLPWPPALAPDPTMTEGMHDQPYAIPNFRVSGKIADLSVPVGSWRAVGFSMNAFFQESLMDEAAHAAGVDPLEMRLRLMADHPAAVGVLRKVAEMSGWGYRLPPGRGMGIAHTLSYETWVAEVVQVRDSGAGIEIEKVWCAADVGEALDPGIVRAQMMSGIVFGLSAAMGQEITFADGEVVQSNFTDYDAMRMNQCPQIEVEVLENSRRIGGAGEPGTPPVIPALANAIFAATGRRIRNLPLAGEIDFA